MAKKLKCWRKVKDGWKRGDGERVFITQLSPREAMGLGKKHHYESWVLRKNNITTKSLSKGVKKETASRNIKSYMRKHDKC